MRKEVNKQIKQKIKSCEEDMKVFIECIEKKWENRLKALEEK